MGEQHDYRYFRGGAPTDTDYQWCSRCGVLKAMPSGDPDTYYEPGAFRFDPYGTTVEPSNGTARCARCGSPGRRQPTHPSADRSLSGAKPIRLVK